MLKFLLLFCLADVGYPSPNFIRPSLVNVEESSQGVSIDEGHRLTIRLHYNPVMDEWVSLTDENTLQSDIDIQNLDILFDLHKKVDALDETVQEVIHMRHFLSVSMN